MRCVLLALTVALLLCSGCGDGSGRRDFEGQVNDRHNAAEFSRSRSEPGYVPNYTRSRVAP